MHIKLIYRSNSKLHLIDLKFNMYIKNIKNMHAKFFLKNIITLSYNQVYNQTLSF